MRLGGTELKIYMLQLENLYSDYNTLLHGIRVARFSNQKLIKLYDEACDKSWKFPSNNALDVLMIYENEINYRGL